MRDVLPTEFGGTVEFDHLKWLAHQRAVEMEEIGFPVLILQTGLWMHAGGERKGKWSREGK